MKRSWTKKYRKKKRLIFFVGAFFLVGIGLATFYLVSDKSGQAQTFDKNQYQYEQYYVPIVHFTSSLESVSLAELTNKFSTGTTEEIYITSDQKENVQKVLKVASYHQQVHFLSDEEILQKITSDRTALAIVPFLAVDSRVKSLSVDNKLLWDKGVSDYPLKAMVTVGDQKVVTKNSFTQNKISLLVNVGDVILGRWVAHKMRIYNDYNHPWLKMADRLSKGDITFINLEVPLSDRITPPEEGMNFVAPQKSISGLKLAGVDVVALANNHSTNFGTAVFADTLELLRSEKINYVGGGMNEAEAYQPLIIEKNNLKWGFVNFNSIIGALEAGEDSPGVAGFAIKPWSRTDNPDDLTRIKTIITQAKQQADIVVAEFHWGVEYETTPIQSQIDVAHTAIDAGADLIVGTHPHIVQAMESYRNVPVFYSLGNFIFDQEWSIETKQGFVAETYFYDKKLISINLVPYQIEDYNQPRLATSDQKGQILSRVFSVSLSDNFRN